MGLAAAAGTLALAGCGDDETSEQTSEAAAPSRADYAAQVTDLCGTMKEAFKDSAGAFKGLPGDPAKMTPEQLESVSDETIAIAEAQQTMVESAAALPEPTGDEDELAEVFDVLDRFAALQDDVIAAAQDVDAEALGAAFKEEGPVLQELTSTSSGDFGFDACG